eukprot:s3513_g2.t1
MPTPERWEEEGWEEEAEEAWCEDTQGDWQAEDHQGECEELQGWEETEEDWAWEEAGNSCSSRSSVDVSRGGRSSVAASRGGRGRGVRRSWNEREEEDETNEPPAKKRRASESPAPPPAELSRWSSNGSTASTTSNQSWSDWKWNGWQWGEGRGLSGRDRSDLQEWLQCSNVGARVPGTHIVPCKTPLEGWMADCAYDSGLLQDDMWFGKEDLLQHCRDIGAPVGLVIDLAAPSEFSGAPGKTASSLLGSFGRRRGRRSMAKLQSACQILGIRDESYLPRFSKDDIEKIRRKTKEVYKTSQKEGKEAKAKQVLDAWKVVDAAFAAVKARRATSSSKHSSSSQPPAPSREPVRKDGQVENGHQATEGSSNKRKAETLDEAAAEREKAAALKRAAEKAASAKKAKEKAAALKKAAEKKAAEKAAHIKKLRSEHRARLAADPPRPCLEKRPSYHRNQSALICKTCQQSSNLRRIPDLKDGVFVCPVCRFRDMDPLSPMKENEKGLLKLILLQPPVLPEETMGEATVRVKLNLPNLQRWRKQGEEVDVRMLSLDTCDTLQCWPHSLTMWANGVQAKSC